LLIEKLKAVTGTDFPIQKGVPQTASGPAIVLKTGAVNVNGIAKEAYKLNVDQNGVTIVGSDAAGVFYGVQSLLQLIPTESYIKKDRFGDPGLCSGGGCAAVSFQEHAPGCGP
jgi:hexosaminidase